MPFKTDTGYVVGTIAAGILVFALGILRAIATRVLIAKYPYRGLFAPGKLRRHIANTKKLASHLPFIYKDLDDGNVLTDYVEVDIFALETPGFATKSSVQTYEDSCRILRGYNNLLILGEAGVGKTTFERHTILKLIHGQPLEFLHAREKPLPIYVPLKAVANTDEFPILKHIVKAGALKLKDLAKLGHRRRLFLLLDGYDEIAYANIHNNEFKERNYIREELNIIFSPSRSHLARLKNDIPDSYFQVYSILGQCRVWLSSRRVYYVDNPLDITDNITNATKEAQFRTIEIKGIKKHRAELVEKIFNKYRRKSSKYNDVLDEEAFLQDLDRQGDTEVTDLSFNPLFLTVMCFIYASKALDVVDKGGDPETMDISWSQNTACLILECVDLLIYDLDFNKARNLGWAKKKAQMGRRRGFDRQFKREFLEWFALLLFIENVALFTAQYIKAKMLEHFREDDSQRAQQIVQELGKSSGHSPNLATQLIYDGIFVTVDLSAKEFQYDFPHRRFREVLAISALNKPVGMLEYWKIKHRPNVQELSELVRSLNVMNNQNLLFETVEKMGCLLASPGANTDDLLRNFVGIAKEVPNGSLLVARLFSLIFAGKYRSGIKVPRECIKLVSSQPEYLDYVIGEYRAAFKMGNLGAVEIALEMMWSKDKVRFEVLLKDAYEEKEVELRCACFVIKFWLRNIDSIGLGFLRKRSCECDHFAATCAYLLVEENNWVDLIKKLDAMGQTDISVFAKCSIGRFLDDKVSRWYSLYSTNKVRVDVDAISEIRKMYQIVSRLAIGGVTQLGKRNELLFAPPDALRSISISLAYLAKILAGRSDRLSTTVEEQSALQRAMHSLDVFGAQSFESIGDYEDAWSQNRARVSDALGKWKAIVGETDNIERSELSDYLKMLDRAAALMTMPILIDGRVVDYALLYHQKFTDTVIADEGGGILVD